MKLFDEVVSEYTAGSPTDREKIWTNLSKKDIVLKFELKGIKVSVYLVKQMFELMGYSKRKNQKQIPLSEVENRNEQFEYISALKSSFLADDNPVLSIDTKKKEFLGNFYREGKIYTKETIKVYDHDYPSYSEGKVIPHGIYDISGNIGYITIGKSMDTAEFMTDNLENYWHEEISRNYKNADTILILCDGGGSNTSRGFQLKKRLQALSNKLKIKIKVAHYPPYCSKWNPIEHKLFCHVHRAMQGTVLSDYQTVKHLIENTNTTTGLQVKVNINSKVYSKAEKLSKYEIEGLNIITDSFLPKWNYAILPN